MARRQGGVELEAHGHQPQEDQHDHLDGNGRAVDGVIGLELPQLLEQLPHAPEDLLDDGEVKGRDAAGQDHR